MAKDILIHPSMQDVVRDKSKKVTIRKGIREYAQEDVVYVGCDSYGWYPVQITDVQFCALGDVPWDAMNDDGFATFKEMREALDKFYPGIDYHADVTVIRWEYL